MTRAILALVLAASLPAQQREHKPPSTTWKISAGTLATSAALDCVSSHGLYETNPLVPTDAQGRFNWQSCASTSGAAAAYLLIQRPIIKRWPAMEKVFSFFNFGIGGSKLVLAGHNWQVKGRRP